MEREQRVTLIRIIISAALLAVAIFVPMPMAARTAVYAAAYLAVAYDILLEAAEGIAHGEVFDENFLMAVASIGAIVLAAMRGDGDYNEAVAVVLLYKVGEFFEDFAVDRSRDSITDLMDLRPDYANVEAGVRLERVDPDTVEVGSVIVVQPGEKIPLDGVVEEGRSSLNVSALTGESVPRDVEPGDEVVSGSVNTSGLLRVRVTRAFGESTASRILRLVEESAERKSKSEKFISRFARVYTPLVCVAALLLALIPPVISMAMGLEPGWQTWIYRALTFLVISCPCALVISIPLTFFAGIGGAGREGILIKGSNYMEALNRVRTVVFDKTGTLTEGEFSVSGVHHSPVEESVVIEYAALAECASTHPISRSIQAASGGEHDRSRVAGVEEISGQGVRATVDGREVAVGNSKLMESIGVEYRDCHHAGTVVHVAMDGDYAGHILVSDQIKEGSAEAVESLRQAGVDRIVMLTGDSAGVAGKVASELGITDVRAELLPEDKVAELEKLLQSQKKADRTAFVGDGINDAPVLSRADLGIAMGALGSDAAIEAADVVLMDDDPRKVAKAIRIARKCMRIVRQNIIFALAVKLVCLALGALGMANMWIAVFADVGVMILAVANATRAMRVRGV